MNQTMSSEKRDEMLRKAIIEGKTAEIQGFTGLESVSLREGQWVILFNCNSLWSVMQMGEPVGEAGKNVPFRKYDFQYQGDSGVLYVSDVPIAVQYTILPMGYSGFERIAVGDQYRGGELHHCWGEDQRPRFEIREFLMGGWTRWTENVRGLGLQPDEALARYSRFLSPLAIICREDQPWEEDQYDENDQLIREGFIQRGPEECWWGPSQEGQTAEEIEASFRDVWVPVDDIELLQALIGFGVTGPLPRKEETAA